MQSLLGNGDAGVEVFGGLTVWAWLFSDLGLGSALLMESPMEAHFEMFSLCQL